MFDIKRKKIEDHEVSCDKYFIPSCRRNRGSKVTEHPKWSISMGALMNMMMFFSFLVYVASDARYICERYDNCVL